MKLIIATILAVAIATASASLASTVLNGLGYQFCTSVRDNLAAIAASGLTEDQADAYADRFCSILKEDAQESCVAIINGKIHAVVEAMRANSAPGDYCEVMYTCSDDNVMLQLDQLYCRGMFANKEAILALDENQLEQYADRLCNLVPSERRIDCIAKGNALIRFFYSKMEGGSDGTDVCDAITDCSDD